MLDECSNGGCYIKLPPKLTNFSICLHQTQRRLKYCNDVVAVARRRVCFNLVKEDLNLLCFPNYLILDDCTGS